MEKQTVFLIINGVNIISYAYIQGAQWLSGRVLETEGLRVRASPASLRRGP